MTQKPKIVVLDVCADNNPEISQEVLESWFASIRPSWSDLSSYESSKEENYDASDDENLEEDAESDHDNSEEDDVESYDEDSEYFELSSVMSDEDSELPSKKQKISFSHSVNHFGPVAWRDEKQNDIRRDSPSSLSPY